MDNTLVYETRDVGSIPTVGTRGESDNRLQKPTVNRWFLTEHAGAIPVATPNMRY